MEVFGKKWIRLSIQQISGFNEFSFMHFWINLALIGMAVPIAMYILVALAGIVVQQWFVVAGFNRKETGSVNLQEND